jgi:peptidase E
MMDAIVQWSEVEDGQKVSSIEALDVLLDDLASRASTDAPIIATIQMGQFLVGVGLGAKLSFVHVESASLNPPYLISRGENNDGALSFYFHGSHHTEISSKNLIPSSIARGIVREIFKSRQLPADVNWEEV